MYGFGGFKYHFYLSGTYLRKYMNKTSETTILRKDLKETFFKHV